MQIQSFREHELTSDQRAAWSDIQESYEQFDSPYYRPEFTKAVAEVCPQVEVGMMMRGGEPVGFFPYERQSKTRAIPVAGILSDFHTVVARPDANWCPKELVSGCGLSAWDFHHLAVHGEEFEPMLRRVVDSPYMDLTGGYEAYLKERRSAGSKKTKQIARLRRKLEREVGTVRIEADCRDEAVFEKLLVWKSAQYQACGLIDLFAMDWVVNLLRVIWREQKPGFRGRLFAMYVNEQPVAAEFAMQSRHVLHSWFPSYDREFSKYGVGHVLTLAMAEAAEDLGITRIDLGKGEEEYKKSLASGNLTIAEGCVDLNPLRRTVRNSYHQTCDWLRTTPIRNVLRRPYRLGKKVLHSVKSQLTKAPAPKTEPEHAPTKRQRIAV